MLVMLVSLSVNADNEEILKLNNTTRSLLDTLVEQGVLSAERAQQIQEDAERKAAEQIKQQEREQVGGEPGVIRVPYVPDYVREDIKNEVSSDLQPKVVDEVVEQAKEEGWGVPAALPDWVRRFSFYGDIRLRLQGDFHSSNNPPIGTAFVDWNEVNENGGFSDSFLNTTEDRTRARLRLRLGANARVTDDLKAGIRIATGSVGNPVSTNQTMGNYFGSNELVLDRAYLQYDAQTAYDFAWLTLWGGRMPQPWFTTELVWDKDVNPDGFAATYRYSMAGSNNRRELYRRDRTLFFTLGAFAVDEIELSDDDKWLFATQLGLDMTFKNKSSFKIALAYYDYHNIEGKRSPVSQPNLYDSTAPAFVQKGNSMFDISNELGEPFQRFGLAPDYNLLDLAFIYDMARYSPYHFIITGDYVENIGYDADEITQRLEGGAMFANSTFFTDDPANEQTTGYKLQFLLGWPKTLVRNSWNVFFSFRHLERDAVLDAFADSDFHLGGTNAEGWIVGGSYALVDNVYLKARYLSADEIVGPPLGIDVLQIDLNTKF